MPDPKLAKWRAQTDIDAEKATADAEAARVADIKADATYQDMLEKLKVATPAQIDGYVDTNVTSLAGARQLLKRMLLVMAIIARGQN